MADVAGHPLRVLGPVEIVLDGTAARFARPQQRDLFALLLLRARRLVTVDQIVEAMWGDAAPATAPSQVQNMVSAIRSVLATTGQRMVALESRRPGYLLHVEDGVLDVATFDRLTAEARRCAGLDAAAELYRAALRLWRGRPLADVTAAYGDGERARLEEQRAAVVEAVFDAELGLGRHAEIVPELADEVARQPFRERLVGQLMTALYRSGRQIDALRAYRTMRQALVDEHGLEPGPALQQLHRRILNDDPLLARYPPRSPSAAARALPDGQLTDGSQVAGSEQPTAAEPGGAAAEERHQHSDAGAGGVSAAPVPPAHLPPDVADFTGRAVWIADLVQRLTRRADQHGTDPRPGVLLYGQGGVGKTALVVRVGHLLRSDFPDGQLFVNLNGAQRRPLDPGLVLAQFLRALGATPSAIPETVDERARLFRSILADRRMLIVLDNAADEEQVRPLLPPAACAVAVTSRRPLAGLEAFVRLRLDMLHPDEATELLGRIAGPARVRAETTAAAEIVRMCAGLPLAVRTAGARLSAKPHWPLARLAARLTDERRRLDELRAGDLEVRASLALSHASLAPEERRALYVAALAPAGDVAAWLIAAGCDIDEGAAEDLAERLVDAQLLEPGATDTAGQIRYRLHDLTRAFAMERFATDEIGASFAEVNRRFLDACVALTAHAVRSADDRVRGFDASTVRVAWPRYPAIATVIEDDPFGWYAAERATLVAAVERAHEAGLPTRAWQLAHTLEMFFEVRAAWDDWRHTHELARLAARASGDRAGEAAILSGLGRLELDRGRFEVALDHLRAAAELARREGVRPVLAQSLQRLAQGHQHSGRHDESAGPLREALALAESVGDKTVQVEVLRGLGWSHQLAGELESATAHYERALAVMDGTANQHHRPWLLSDLGRVHRDAGRHEAAARRFREAVDLAEQIGDRRAAIQSMYALGDAHRQAGDLAAARDLLEQALAHAKQLHSDHAEALALRRLGVTYCELGRHDDARTCLTRALALARAMGHVQMEGVTLLDLGTAHARAGRMDDAVSALEMSIPIFREFGLGQFEGRAEQELREARNRLVVAQP